MSAALVSVYAIVTQAVQPRLQGLRAPGQQACAQRSLVKATRRSTRLLALPVRAGTALASQVRSNRSLRCPDEPLYIWRTRR